MAGSKIYFTSNFTDESAEGICNILSILKSPHLSVCSDVEKPNLPKAGQASPARHIF